MSSTGVRKKRTPFDIAIESLRDTNNADIEAMKRFSGESSPISGQAGGASTNSATPGGSFLNIAGQTPMLGAIAFNPVDVIIDSNGRIGITPGADAPSNYSTYVLMTGAGTPDDLNFIDGAANNGQLLYLQGTAAQVLTIKHAKIGTISSIVGTTTVTVVTSATHNLTTGNKVDISGTTNFNIQNATITVTGGTTFTYSATGSGTAETSGTFQNGNIVTSDGIDTILDGTKATNAVPWIALLFDPTITAFGAWRVQFGAGVGGLTEPIILTPNTITPQTLPTKSTIDWSKNPNVIALDRAVEFEFSNLPITGKYEGVLVIIDIGSTVGFASPIWPASVTNPPTISIIANTRTSVMLYTINAGTTVTHATSVGSSSSGGTTTLSGLTIDVNKNWEAQGISNFGSLTGVTGIDLDGVAATIQGIANLTFFQANHSINSLSGIIQIAVATTDSIRFVAGGTEIARFTEQTAGVYRLNMADHAIDAVKDISFDVNASFSGAGSTPTIGYNNTTARLLINMPAGGNLFVTNNNVIGSTNFNNNAIITNILTASDVFQLGVDVTTPTVVGEFRNDGTDVNVFSGGAIRNLSNIGVAGGANVNLSNLSSPTSVNQNIIPQAGKLLGDSGNPWSTVTSNKISLGTAGTFTASDNAIIADAATGMELNTPTGDLFSFFFGGGSSSAIISVSQFRMVSGNFRGTGLSLDNAGFDPVVAGEFRLNGADVKVFSGGAVKNLSDIGTGAFLPLAGGTMTGVINMGNNDLTAVDDIFFNATNTEITQAAGIMSIRVGTSDIIRLRRGTVSGFIYDSNGFKFGTGLNIGVFGTTPVAKQTVTGSRGGNAALASLLTALANFGWITDSTTA